MGTQFTSRLKESDRERIIEGIADALEDTLVDAVANRLPFPKPGKRGADTGKQTKQRSSRKAPATGKGSSKTPSTKTVKTLSGAQRQRFGDAAVSQVLSVAADRGFFSVFEESQLFVDVLKWILRLRSDAEFNGFEGIIREYNMKDSVNPIGVLARKRQELTDKAKADPFRIASTNAVKAILVETSLRKVPQKTGEAPASTFGRQLAIMSVRDLVTRYIHSFVYEVLSKSMSMSDPTSSATVVQEAIVEIRKATERIARKAVDRIVKEGKLNDTLRIHQIVIEGLMEYIRPEAA
jgi:hypothetical protein